MLSTTSVWIMFPAKRVIGAAFRPVGCLRSAAPRVERSALSSSYSPENRAPFARAETPRGKTLLVRSASRSRRRTHASRGWREVVGGLEARQSCLAGALPRGGPLSGPWCSRTRLGVTPLAAGARLVRGQRCPRSTGSLRQVSNDGRSISSGPGDPEEDRTELDESEGRLLRATKGSRRDRSPVGQSRNAVTVESPRSCRAAIASSIRSTKALPRPAHKYIIRSGQGLAGLGRVRNGCEDPDRSGAGSFRQYTLRKSQRKRLKIVRGGSRCPPRGGKAGPLEEIARARRSRGWCPRPAALRLDASGRLSGRDRRP